MRASGSESNATQPSWPEVADCDQRTVSNSDGPCSLARIATRTSEPSRGAVAIGARRGFFGWVLSCRAMLNLTISETEHGTRCDALQGERCASESDPARSVGA